MDIEHLDRSACAHGMAGEAPALAGARWMAALCAILALLLPLVVAPEAAAQPAGRQPPGEQPDEREPDADEPPDAGQPPAGDEPEEPLMGEPPAEPPPQPVPKPAEPKDDVKAEAGKAPPKGAEGEVEVGEKPKGEERPDKSELAGPASEVYAEDWWKLSRPVFEIHGYYRVRSEFFHNFHLGRVDANSPLWPRPPVDSYVAVDSQEDRAVVLCGDDPEPSNFERCQTNTQAGANMRFRLEPELHVSDNVRIRAQIDLLDNIVLGSTPQGYANVPADGGGYAVVSRGGFTPLGAFAATQWAPRAGVNSTADSILVKRVWGEYSSPIGQLRFGRMPNQWGLGILANAGDSFDSDWQSTADRIMFITGIKSWDLYFAAAWDFANEGPTSANFNELEGQPYDLTQKDDLDQWVFVVVRRMNEQLQRKALRDGDPVFNGGAWVVYRQQNLANEEYSLTSTDQTLRDTYVRRGAWAVIPDAWFQFLFDTFRLEIEAVMIWGEIENTEPALGNNYVNQQVPDDDGWNIRQFGIAAEAEYRAIEERLRLGFDFGFASGDSDVEGLRPSGEGLQPQLTRDRTYSTFRFHPNYRIDLILWRQIMTRVQGAYYFKPSVAYDFIRDPDGQKIGGGASVIWSRAAEFVQTPGNAHDLGVEINVRLYYQAKDGVLNDDPDKMGGFYTAVEYGVLFPLNGLGYVQGTALDYQNATGGLELDKKTAQTVRWLLGILY